jgi:hypothetical protein
MNLPKSEAFRTFSAKCTGDRGRFLPGTCRCGSILRRIETTRKLRNGITLHNGVFVPLHELDEALFFVPWPVDYTASADDENVLVSLYAPARKESSPKAALRNRPFLFRFLPHVHDGVSSRKRIAG